MSMFKKLMTQSAVVKTDAETVVVGGSADVALLVATAEHAEAMSAVHAGEVEGIELQLELDVMDETVARIDSALFGIQAASIGGGAAPALSTESLNILDRTLLADVGVVSTGMESSSSLGPVETTTEVILGLEAIMADAGKAIKEAFYKFIDWIQLQFGKIFGGLEKTKAKAEAIKKKADAFEGSKSKDNVKVKLSALVKGDSDKAISTTIPADIKALGELATKTVSDVEVAALASVDAVDTAIGKSADDWKKADAPAFNDVKTKWTAVVTATDTLVGTDGTEIIGGRKLEELGDEVKDNSKVVPGKLTLSLKAPVKAVEDKEIAPLSLAAIIDTCEAIVDACDAMIASRKKLVDSKSFKSKFGKIADASDKLSADKDYNANQTDIRLATKVARTAGMIANGSFRYKLVAVFSTVAAASLAYADKSIKKA